MVSGAGRAAAVAWLALLVAGCSEPAGDAIVFALARAPTTLDPRLASDAASERVNALLYDRLVALDRHGRPVPAMANWQRLGDRLYRLALRPDRTAFADGRLPHAADVAATYRSLLDPRLGSPHAGALAHVARVEPVDDDHVDFHLARPDPRFPARLTIGIAPAAAIDAGNLARHPHGSGGFRFVGWRSDGGLTLERRADSQRITLLPVPDPTMRALKLLRGEAQLLQNDLPSELYDYLAARPQNHLRERPGTTFAYIGFNLEDPVLADRDVRAAIAHAIDREAIIRYLFDGRAETAESVLRPTHWAGNDELTPFGHDPDRARRLLQLAGHGPDRPLQLVYKTSTDPFRLRIAHVFQQQLAAVGIELRISSHEWGTFFGDIRAGNFQMYGLAWVGVNSPDILRYAFHSASLPPAGANRGRYRSPELDRLVELAETRGLDTAAPLYRAAQRLVHDDLVYVPLWYEANVAASRGIAGYVPGHDGNYLALETVRHATR
jgi:peptide/nickel transport system substrate-binding protein